MYARRFFAGSRDFRPVIFPSCVVRDTPFRGRFQIFLECGYSRLHEFSWPPIRLCLLDFKTWPNQRILLRTSYPVIEIKLGEGGAALPRLSGNLSGRLNYCRRPQASFGRRFAQRCLGIWLLPARSNVKAFGKNVWHSPNTPPKGPVIELTTMSMVNYNEEKLCTLLGML